MFNDSMFGLVVFVSAYVISRIIGESALRKLSVEQKATLLDAFSSYRIYSLVLVFAIVVAYLVLTYLFVQYDHYLTPFFFALILIVMISSSFFSYQKLRTLNMPGSYLTMFWISTLIQFIGIIFLFASTLARSLGY